MFPKTVRAFFLLSLLFVIGFSASIDLAKVKEGGFFSDESTYYGIIQSLAMDGDLRYERRDIQRIREAFKVGPMGIFLKRGRDGRLYFAKSFIYPLLAAPFFRLFGVHGILLANGLMLLAVLLMGYLLLRQHHAPRESLSFTLLYLFGSVACVYVWWTTADLFNFFVNFAALFFFFYNFRRPAWGHLAAVFFAAAVFSKPNNLLHIGVLFLLLLARREWKRFAVLSLLSVLLVAGLFVFNYVQTGEVNYQGGERRAFYGNFPLERPDFTFEAGAGNRMTSDTYWDRFYLSPAIALYNAFYYVFGRFTGLFIYFFPALFALLLFCLQKKAREDWFLLAAAVLAVLFYILVMPDNYFGGGGSLGNRYFLNVFPLFFFLGHRQRSFRFSLAMLLPAVLFLAPVYMHALGHSASPRYPGVTFPSRLFPAEKTQCLTLPSNTNPWAFNKKIGGQYALFMLNDNFHPVEGNFFWTRGNRELEFFLLAPFRVGALELQLRNIAKPNHVSLAVEHKRKTVFLEPEGVRLVRFVNVPGLRLGNRYVYQVKVRSRQSLCPYFDTPGSRDLRQLGVQVRIRVYP